MGTDRRLREMQALRRAPEPAGVGEAGRPGRIVRLAATAARARSWLAHHSDIAARVRIEWGVPGRVGHKQRNGRAGHGGDGADAEQHPVGGQRRQDHAAQHDDRGGQEGSPDRAGDRAADQAGQRVQPVGGGELRVR